MRHWELSFQMRLQYLCRCGLCGIFLKPERVIFLDIVWRQSISSQRETGKKRVAKQRRPRFAVASTRLRTVRRATSRRSSVVCAFRSKQRRQKSQTRPFERLRAYVSRTVRKLPHTFRAWDTNCRNTRWYCFAADVWKTSVCGTPSCVACLMPKAWRSVWKDAVIMERRDRRRNKHQEPSTKTPKEESITEIKIYQRYSKHFYFETSLDVWCLDNWKLI